MRGDSVPVPEVLDSTFVEVTNDCAELNVSIATLVRGGHISLEDIRKHGPEAVDVVCVTAAWVYDGVAGGNRHVAPDTLKRKR